MTHTTILLYQQCTHIHQLHITQAGHTGIYVYSNNRLFIILTIDVQACFYVRNRYFYCLIIEVNRN